MPFHDSPAPNLVWLDQGHTSRSQVGGKAASLSSLLALGAPVPSAFALTVDAYAEFSAVHGFPRCVTDVTLADLPQLRDDIVSAPLPVHLADTVATAYQEMRERANGELSLAVRSSGTAEDSAAFSFAGLHDTVLDVRSLAGLEAAIKRCWASLWTDRAIQYRLDGGLAADPPDIAVVVQQLVRSDVSFIAFSADPVSQDDSHVVIDASWGLGEAIVSGLVVPDHITINASGEVKEYAVGSKHLMVIPGECPDAGTREVHVPRMLQQMPALTHSQASAIAAMARELARKFGYQVDLEGGIAGGQIHIFQARPITTLGR
jgi:pyruvate,water dikinase